MQIYLPVTCNGSIIFWEQQYLVLTCKSQKVILNKSSCYYIAVSYFFYTYRSHADFINYNSVIIFYSKLKVSIVLSKLERITIHILSLYILFHVYWPLLSRTGTNYEFLDSEAIRIFYIKM